VKRPSSCIEEGVCNMDAFALPIGDLTLNRIRSYLFPV
jgi:hypothetical protein